MRTGLLAKKVGMTRLFGVDGSHVRRDGAAGRGMRGRGACGRPSGTATRPSSSASGAPSRRTSPSRCAATSPRRRSSRSGSWASSGSPTTRCSRWGRGSRAEHFVAGQLVDVQGREHRQGLRRCHEAAQFRRPARLARRVDLAPQPRLDRQPPGPRPDLQEQEDGRPSRCREGHGAEPRGVRRRRRPRA